MEEKYDCLKKLQGISSCLACCPLHQYPSANSITHSYRQTLNSLLSKLFLISIYISKQSNSDEINIIVKVTWSQGRWCRSFNDQWPWLTRNRTSGNARAQELEHGTPRVGALSVTEIRQKHSCKQASIEYTLTFIPNN